jgi:hypothetical protein
MGETPPSPPAREFGFQTFRIEGSGGYTTMQDHEIGNATASAVSAEGTHVNDSVARGI